MKKIAYSNQAIKALRRIPANEAQRIRAKIDEYARDPASQAKNVKMLRGRDGLRLRVGNWRVIFNEDDQAIDVLVIGPRGGIYE